MNCLGINPATRQREMPEKSHERCLFLRDFGLQISNCFVPLSLTFDLCLVGSIYHFAPCSSCAKQVVRGMLTGVPVCCIG